jgi:hypothetical protein
MLGNAENDNAPCNRQIVIVLESARLAPEQHARIGLQALVVLRVRAIAHYQQARRHLQDITVRFCDPKALKHIAP